MTISNVNFSPSSAASPSPVSGTAQRVVFGRLQTDDPVSLVARRLRTAIGLEVITDGDRLPKEADLARQLGVTAFSLREALGVLRTQGLIVTRSGKNGGSFVRLRPEAGRSLAADELRQMSATELRDLGDWRQMLTAQAAALAASRGSDASAEQLLIHARHFAQPDSARTARKIFGHFHLELAAAAQSMRLSRAELTMHEEFDWLATVLMDREAHLRQSARGLTAIATAVRMRDADAARSAAADLINYLVTELAQSRLAFLADQHRDRGAIPATTPTDFRNALRGLAKRFVDRLIDIGQEVTPLLVGAEEASKLRVRVGQSVLSRLDDLDAIVNGIGVLAQTCVVSGSPYWMNWWQRSSNGAFSHDERHVLNPRREDFYDYSSKEFFTLPRARGVPCAIGPYVDYGGVDDYLITMAVPMFHESMFIGIAAADLRVAELEKYFAPWLAQAEGAFMLLNAESRVIISNTVDRNVGDVVRTTKDLLLKQVGIFGWSIATSDVPFVQTG